MAPDRYAGVHYLPETEAVLFYTLVQEQHAPACIVHGYEGYKSEAGLRTAFIDLIEEHVKLGGHELGISSFPTLVTSNNFCLIKGNGHPYLAIRDDHSWVAVFSTRHNPATVILEIIWAKIASHFNAKMPFGEDLSIEKIAPLLIAVPKKICKQIGWTYNSIEYK